MREIAAELLLSIEPRGQDATGMAWFGKGGGMVVDKLDVRATAFTNSGLKMNNDAPTAILHTRLATTGHPKDNKNNHPIVAPYPKGDRVVLTHNGWVNNYASLTRLHGLRRGAEVDSEVIASFLQQYGDDYDKLGDAIDGNYSLAYLREDKPGELFLVRGHSSPLVVSVTNHGVFYASTEFALKGIEQYVGGPLVGYVEVAEGRAVRVENGEMKDTISFDLRDRWSNYYGNRVHTNTTSRTAYGTTVGGLGWDDDDERWYSQHRRSWTVDGDGVAHLSTPKLTDSSMLRAYTDLKRGVRVWYGADAPIRAEFLGLEQEHGAELASAYGKYVWLKDKGGSVEFYPWPSKDEMTTDEAALEDLLFLTASMEPAKLPDSIRYELSLLSSRLDRKNTAATRDGIILGPDHHVDGGYVYRGNDLVPYEDLASGYVKVGDTWYFTRTDPKLGYQVSPSSFQNDTDHVDPRTVTPPAALTPDGDGMADYCLIGEEVYGQNGDGVWSPLGLRVDQLSDEELVAIVGERATESEAMLTFEHIEEVNALVLQGLGSEDTISATKVG
jgi:hypothetical protein